MAPKVSDQYIEKIEKNIVKTAKKQFAKKGYVKTSMDDIAKAANTSKGGLYHHFASKEDLFAAICVCDPNPVIQDSMKRLFRKKENLKEDLEIFYQNAVVPDRDMEKLWIEIFSEAQRNPKIKKIVNQTRIIGEKALVELLLIIKDNLGLLKNYQNEDLQMLASSMYSFFVGLTIIQITSNKSDTEIRKMWINNTYTVLTKK